MTAKSSESKEVIKKMDQSVLSVIGNRNLAGFEKAHQVSSAIVNLKSLLTEEYMRPIMALQGMKLGFKTDKDKNGGYSMDVVKNCVIEATLMGLEVTGNHFNIIAGQLYLTKEGCGYLLNKFPGLKYNLVCSIPKVNQEKTGAAVDVTISWEINGSATEKTIPLAIRMDQYTSVDAVIGKATRKGRAWLLSTITGTEVTDGEVEDTTFKVVDSTLKVSLEDLQFLYDTKKSSLTPAEQEQAERILNTKEEKSYQKLKTFLSSK